MCYLLLFLFRSIQVFLRLLFVFRVGFLLLGGIAWRVGWVGRFAWVGWLGRLVRLVA